MTDEEKIDYEIKAKRAEKNKNVEEWGCAFSLAFVFLMLLVFLSSLL